MFSDDFAPQISQLFKTLSNEKARIILRQLYKSESPLSVSDLSNLSKVDYSSTVKVCKSLLGLQVIESKRTGKFTYYNLNTRSPVATIADLVDKHFKTANEWI